MIINGNNIRDEIINELKVRLNGKTASLGIIVVGENPVTERFIAAKERAAAMIGVQFFVERLSDSSSTEEVIVRIAEMDTDGIVVQLPLPHHIDQVSVLDTIPANKDVDVLGFEAYQNWLYAKDAAVPPVTGALFEILHRSHIDLSDKKIGVVGQGQLVGKPFVEYCRMCGYDCVVFEKGDDLAKLAQMDIIVSGAGVPGLITPDLVKWGAVILDAGTSERAGKVLGDVDPFCAEKASVFTPTPGGIGPITVAVLFRNLVNAVQ